MCHNIKLKKGIFILFNISHNESNYNFYRIHPIDSSHAFSPLANIYNLNPFLYMVS